ncbi:hypothetical protein KDAU_56310 [Dictyobacter aurantiacus]|uniref:Uncharacterized protein n=1 Tax=Dictyobacter aurantiacus TaxID=1936993 RepID=A0A401ZN70_9CHLR|nr:hypothetical protein KDAU_56310 [Dictyobacter aurantiacus]
MFTSAEFYANKKTPSSRAPGTKELAHPWFHPQFIHATRRTAVAMNLYSPLTVAFRFPASSGCVAS